MLFKFKHSHILKRFGAISVLVAYAFLTLISLSVFGVHSHSMTLKEGCPYIQGTHSLCQMDTLGHIEAWSKATRTLIPLVFIFITAIIVVVAHASLQRRGTRVNRRPYFPTLYTLLFAQGILHPKIP